MRNRLERFLVLPGMLGTFLLTGCLMSSDSIPDTVPATPLGTIQGSNFGGHAPIVGAHVYVLEVDPAALTYGAKAVSLLTGPAGQSASGYPEFVDASGDPTNGFYFVTTDSNGGFNISGDYTCRAGYPVYLYAAGGSPQTSPAINITSAAVTSETTMGTGYSTNITFTANNLLYAGETVTLNMAGSGPYTSLNGPAIVVTSATLTSFSVTVTGTTLISGTDTGTATSVPANNPGIVNLAVLGNCPSTGSQNFSSLKFVYMNEVSTTAAAYALAGFASSTANDAVHIGIPTGDALALQGIQNAALTAAQLYDIQGTNVSTTPDGEGHIARATTPMGGNTVPQALLDTLGNILASCVDSNNSSSALTLGATGAATSASATCGNLFGTATNNGTTTGVVPNDTATAAINIAHFPAGVNNSGFVTTLGALGTGIVPFTPNTSAETDFTVGIVSKSMSGLNDPVDIAIDKAGNQWISNGASNETCNDTLLEFTALGAPTGNVNTIASCTGAMSGTSEYNLPKPVATTIDNSGSVWTSTSGSSGDTYTTPSVFQLTSVGALASGPFLGGTLQSGGGMASDGNYIFVADPKGNQAFALNYRGATYLAGNSAEAPCLAGASYISEGGGYGWVASTANSTICAFNIASILSGAVDYVKTGLSSPHSIAIDALGNAWVANAGNNSLTRVTQQGSVTTYTGGGLNSPMNVAIDGNGFIWVANAGSGAGLSEFAATATGYPVGTAITPSAGVANIHGGPALAFDGSGNLWVADSLTNQVTEYVGIGGPVVTPLSGAIATAKVGVRP